VAVAAEILHTEQPLVGALGVGQHTARGCAVDVPAFQQKADEAPFRHLQLLGGGAQVGAVPQVDKQVVVDGLALQPGVVRLQRRVFLTLGQQVGAELQQGFRRGGDLPQLFSGEVSSVLADAGQDFIEHPAFKSLRRGQLAVDDEAVNVAFGDKEHLHHLYGG